MNSAERAFYVRAMLEGYARGMFTTPAGFRPREEFAECFAFTPAQSFKIVETWLAMVGDKKGAEELEAAGMILMAHYALCGKEIRPR